MRAETRRWLRQAEADLKAAKDSLNSENFEWSCFQAQQSAEKALKALLYNKGYSSLTSHSVKLLWKQTRSIYNDFPNLSEEARLLDAYYIPTRYPNGLDSDIAPVDYFDKEDALKCLNCATSILDAVKKYLQK